MHDVLHKIIDAVAGLKALSHNETAELHAAIDQDQAQTAGAQDETDSGHGASGA